MKEGKLGMNFKSDRRLGIAEAC